MEWAAEAASKPKPNARNVLVEVPAAAVEVAAEAAHGSPPKPPK